MVTSMLLNLTPWLVKSVLTFWIIEFSLHLNQQKFFFSHFDSVKILSEKFENILNLIKIVIEKKRVRRILLSFLIVIEIENEKISNWFFFRIFFFVVFFHSCSFLFISRSAVFYCSTQNWLKNQVNCFF